MASEEWIYDTNAAQASLRAGEIDARGGAVLCPVCRARMTVAVSPEIASKKGVAPGIYCSVSRDHLWVQLYFRSRKP